MGLIIRTRADRDNMCTFSLQECTRKEADLLANSAVFQDKFSAACKDMGIAVGHMVHTCMHSTCMV